MKQLNWYQIFGNTKIIPDGATVLPTDDIQILLNCANIWDKTYTTLEELLADTDTLLAVINSENAIDYLVRSTTWAARQALVPIMTSNTTPSGVCFASSELNSTYAAWKAFDGDDTTRWQSVEEAPNYSRCGYSFDDPQKISVAYIKGRTDNNSSFKVRYSDDGVNWADLTEFVTLNSSNSYSYTFVLSPAEAHRYYEFYGKSASNGYGCQIYTAQFYSASITTDSNAMSYIGQNNYAANTLLADATWCEAICNSAYFESVLNVKVPTMTSATTPEGEVIGTFGATIGGQTYYGWKCFDGNDSTEGIGTSTSNQIIGYMFTSSICLKKVHLVVDNYRRWNAGAKLQGSNDGNTWTDIYTTDSVVTGTIDLNISNHTSYLGYRFANLNASVNPSAQTIQFYGRKDV